MKKDNTDAAFRKKLEEFSPTPPSHIFDGIMSEMAAIKRKKRRAAFAWISAAAVVLIAFMAGWLMNENIRNINSPMVAEKTSEQNNSVQKQLNAPFSNQENPRDISDKQLVEITEKQSIKTTNQFVSKTKIKNDNNQKKQNIALENDYTGNDFERTTGLIKLDYLEGIKALLASTNIKASLITNSTKQNSVASLGDEKGLIAANIKNYKNKKAQPGKWKLGVNIAPGYSAHQVSHSDVYARNMTYAGTNGNTDVGGGLSVQYKTSKRLRIESGVYYAKNGQKSENSSRLFAFSENADYAFSAAPAEKSFFGNAVVVDKGEIMMNSTAGVIAMKNAPQGAEVSADFDSKNIAYSNTLLTNGEFSQVFDFIEIPLFLRYTLIDKKVGVEVLGGVNAGFVVGNNAFIDNQYGLQNIGKTQDISPLNFSGAVGVGVNYTLNQNLSLSVEPRINYYLNSINTNPNVDYRPYRIGIFTGVYYEF